MNRIKEIMVIVLMSAAFLVPISASAFQIASKFDYEKMERDLRIMEKVIDTIINDELEGNIKLYSTNRTMGVYLEEYGVIFMVPANSSSFVFSITEAHDLKEKRERPERGEIEVTVETKGEEDDDIGVTLKLKESLMDFLATYADAIKQLRDDDNITIFVNAPRKSGFTLISETYTRAYALVEGKKDKIVKHLEPFALSVKKYDVKRLRQRNIGLEEFKEKVQFSRFGENEKRSPEMTEDIKILITILETALEEHFETKMGNSFIQGTYLDNFGVLFTVDMNRLNLWMSSKFTPVSRFMRESRVVTGIARRNDEKKEDIDFKEIIGELKDISCEIIADFGHTLRNLKNDEKVYLFVSSRNGFHMSSYDEDVKSNFMMIVEKENIERYRNGTIDFEDFKDRAVFKEF